MAESFFSHLLNGLQIVVDDSMDTKGIGPKLGGGLRSAPSGMAFVDITGRVDADADGIVFEGIPGMERPIIPKFVVPKELAGKLSKLVEGDSIDIEKQRRAGNTNIQFDENKFNKIISSLEKEGNLGVDLMSVDENSSVAKNTKWKGARPPLREVLPYADLSGADFSNVDMSGMDLSSANLSLSILRSSNFSNANLKDANLFGANLSLSNLSDTDLRGANIFAANVSEANLSGALMPDMANTYLIGADSAKGMSSRTLGRQGMQSLTTRDRRKLDSFVEETLKEWSRKTHRSTADDQSQSAQDAYQEAVLKLLQQVEEDGMAPIEALVAQSQKMSKIKEYMDMGLSDDRIISVMDEVTQKDIDSVRKFGAPSAARLWVNRVSRTSVVDQARKESLQKGQMPARQVAEARLNNAVWDLIDSGASDEEIIDAIRSNQKINQPEFAQGRLDRIRKEGRKESMEGFIDINQGVTSFEAENARRGRGEEDWASGDELGTELAQEDTIDTDVDVMGDTSAESPISAGQELSDEKSLRVKKLKEALSDSFDVLQAFSFRRSKRSSKDRPAQEEIAQELGITQRQVSAHMQLIDIIRKRVEDGTFNDPDWLIPFNEIAEAGKTENGIEELSKKYDIPLREMTLLARQVSTTSRRMDVRSSGQQERNLDFAAQYADLIKKGYSRGEIYKLLNMNSQQALDKRIEALKNQGVLDSSFTDREILKAIQDIRKNGTSAVSGEMLETLKNLGVNVSELVPMAGKIKEATEEDKTFEAMQSSGKSRGEIMAAMNLSPEQYQRLYARIRARNLKK